MTLAKVRLAYMQMEHRRRFRQDVAWNVAALKWRVACFSAIVSLVSAATPSSRRRRSAPNSCCSTLSLCRNISFWKKKNNQRIDMAYTMVDQKDFLFYYDFYLQFIITYYNLCITNWTYCVKIEKLMTIFRYSLWEDWCTCLIFARIWRFPLGKNRLFKPFLTFFWTAFYIAASSKNVFLLRCFFPPRWTFKLVPKWNKCVDLLDIEVVISLYFITQAQFVQISK